MNKFNPSEMLRGFSPTLERDSGNAIEGRSFAVPECPAKRPDSGRRPDDAGLPASDPSVLARLPTIEGSHYVVLCSHGSLVCDFEAASDREAIAIARVENPDSPLSCETALAPAAKALGLRTAKLSKRQAMELAMVAMMPMIAGSLTEEAFESIDIPRFLYACAGFAWARPWRSDLAGRAYDVSVSDGRKFLLVLQQEGVEPGAGFGLLRSDARARRVGAVNVVEGMGELFVTMHRVPAPLRERLRSVNETDSFPWATSLRKSPHAAPLTREEACLVVALFECLAALSSGHPRPTVVVDDLHVTMAPSIASSAS